MKSIRHILTLVLLCIFSSVSMAVDKKTVTTDELSRQRFLYYFYEAQRLFQHAEYQTAYQLFEFCRYMYPDDPVINLYMGDFFFGFKRPSLAVPYYEMSYKADPKNEHILERLEQAYYYTRNTKKALHIQDLIDQRDGYNYYSALQRYHIYASVGDVKNACKQAERYLKEDPEDVQFLLLRLQALELMKTPQKKLKQAYEQILELDPENLIVMNNYAYFLATHKGDLKIAEDYSRYTIQAQPDNPVFLDTYAWILYLRGETQLAQMYIKQALHISNEQTVPDEVLLHYQIIMNSR